jgi:hypothetical protein
MRTLAKMMLLSMGMMALYPAIDAFAYSPSTLLAEQAVGFSKEDLIKLLEAKVSDGTIIAYIKKNSPAPSISAQELIELRTAGASDAVLVAIVEASGTTSPLPAKSPHASPPSGDDYAASQGYYNSVPYSSNDYPGYYYYPNGYYSYPNYGFGFGFGIPFRVGDRFHHFNPGVGHFQSGTHGPVVGSHGTVRGGGGSGGGHGGGGHH